MLEFPSIEIYGQGLDIRKLTESGMCYRNDSCDGLENNLKKNLIWSSLSIGSEKIYDI